MWRDLARENFGAASLLLRNELWRPSGSRAYYAAFCMITWSLENKGLTPRPGLGTWPHAALPGLAAQHLAGGGAAAANLGFALGRLYHLRLVADYAPGLLFTQHEAREAGGLMSQVFRQLAGEARR